MRESLTEERQPDGLSTEDEASSRKTCPMMPRVYTTLVAVIPLLSKVPSGKSEKITQDICQAGQ
jgi:hypothetical protein